MQNKRYDLVHAIKYTTIFRSTRTIQLHGNTHTRRVSCTRIYHQIKFECDSRGTELKCLVWPLCLFGRIENLFRTSVRFFRNFFHKLNESEARRANEDRMETSNQQPAAASDCIKNDQQQSHSLYFSPLLRVWHAAFANFECSKFNSDAWNFTFDRIAATAYTHTHTHIAYDELKFDMQKPERRT